ncbi:teichoic acid transport system ATP-binding protein [Cytobacillus horneckiae]|uniref:teichoic acids export ABC transporter ATP-binding subunit TagH n=1 Tax=Cytobacillus horneckiae TaxID=549687 RepID=UPI0019D034A7|nr:teichoic acids export ABC transporter ATP-binding subunit TagH [Cytobacillus horneckiae]MBN6885245.1 teichoic acids export ABC transporter ATP-binding subunit TagH [Cytobacillus horneckiae]
MNESVVLENVSKKFKMYNKSSEKLLDIIIPDGYGEDFYALQNITFIANKGDVIGIIGVNGAGKSTLSNILTGVIPPSNGSIKINGQASLIAIASGLNNQLTGRENIELKCLMLGFSKKEINQLMPDIIDFADIGKFIDQPVKKYSSGMKSRLGFAISVNINPDILVIDEALSVGDQTFTDKCLAKMNEFKENGKTIFFISHSIGQVKKFCQKALWLEAGEVREYGSIDEIIPKYQSFLKEFKEMSKEDQKNFKQLVLEKRSKLQKEHEEVTALGTEGQLMGRNQTRSNRKRNKGIQRLVKSLTFSLIALGLVIGGIVYVSQSGILKELQAHNNNQNSAVSPPEQAVEEPKEKDNFKEKPEVLYVNVPLANIRENPNSESTILYSPTFGEGFTVQEIQVGSDGRDWFKVVVAQTSGWISSTVVSKIEEQQSDETIINSIESALTFVPRINEVIPVLGVSQETANNFDYTTYKYNEDNLVNEFEITIKESMGNTVIAQLGDPTFNVSEGKKLLYAGEDYNYILTLSSESTVESLRVRQVEK